ncbi:hypothetical protein EYF80_016036 [Liparis tanakae]|uniref:Uncharacterized protein n=1 Tax=Liparis tanakae TaxID=230148 RepID=A0A4Z2I6I5_9TELE|nr:hypothetical protein EYF80_016036 [Liparis tanakae]
MAFWPETGVHEKRPMGDAVRFPANRHINIHMIFTDNNGHGGRRRVGVGRLAAAHHGLLLLEQGLELLGGEHLLLEDLLHLLRRDHLGTHHGH